MRRRRKGGPPQVALDIRFWAKVEKRADDECWHWLGSVGAGYGRIRLGDRIIPATHASWLIHNFELPCPGLEVCHKCDNPLCVNPSHLFITDHQGNMSDMVAKARAPRGERTRNARLTTAQVQRIRQSGERVTDLAREFGVSYSTIRHARIGRSWRYVESIDKSVEETDAKE